MQKLALTSPISGDHSVGIVRLQTTATDLFVFIIFLLFTHKFLTVLLVNGNVLLLFSLMSHMYASWATALTVKSIISDGSVWDTSSGMMN
jgi:hypothetical protein